MHRFDSSFIEKWGREQLLRFLNLPNLFRAAKLRVFQLNDCDWYVGRTLDEAVDECVRLTGCDRDEILDDPHELTDAAVDKFKIYNEDRETFVTGRQAVEELIAAGRTAGFFASTEF